VRDDIIEAAVVAILRVLKPLSKEDRLNALAIACHAFCATNMTLEMPEKKTY